MQKKSFLFSGGIFAVFALMFLPWALRIVNMDADGTLYYHYYWMSYCLGTVLGDPFSTISALFALAALIVALLYSFGRVRRLMPCGILLLLSAGAEIGMGISLGFWWYTPLTYFIVGSLIVLALIAFRTDSKAPSATR